MRGLSLLVAAAFTLIMAAVVAADTGPSGQIHFGMVSVEPAFDLTTGKLIYLLTPDKAPFPSKANAIATAPMDIVVYPTGSTVGPLDCTPTNCDHLQSLDPGLVSALQLDSVYPAGVVKGHDHLVGVAKTGGDFNVAWHVVLFLFTPQGVSDGAINHHLTTQAAIDAAVAAKDLVGPINTPITFNCSVVSSATYHP